MNSLASIASPKGWKEDELIIGPNTAKMVNVVIIP